MYAQLAVGPDHGPKSSCRYPYESSSTSEVGLHASCRWSL